MRLSVAFSTTPITGFFSLQCTTCWTPRTACQTYSREAWRTKGEMRLSSCLHSSSRAGRPLLSTASSTPKTTASTWSSACRPRWAKVSGAGDLISLSTLVFRLFLNLPVPRCQSRSATRRLMADLPPPALITPPWQTAETTTWCFTPAAFRVALLASKST